MKQLKILCTVPGCALVRMLEEEDLEHNNIKIRIGMKIRLSYDITCMYW